MNNTYKLVIGDWSGDGHGKCQDFLYKTNKELSEIQQAYRDSCELTGVAFHHSHGRGWREICTNYDEYVINNETLELLLKHGMPDDMFENYPDEESQFVCSDDIAGLIMWFIGLSLENFEYEGVNSEIKAINGWWGGLNHQFGYGVFE